MINTSDKEYIRIYGAATLVAIEEKVLTGQDFEAAKKECCTKVMKSQKCRSEVRETLWQCVSSISVEDLGKQATRMICDRTLGEIETMRGKKARFIERQYYYLTGMVFWA